MGVDSARGSRCYFVAGESCVIGVLVLFYLFWGFLFLSSELIYSSFSNIICVRN